MSYISRFVKLRIVLNQLVELRKNAVIPSEEENE